MNPTHDAHLPLHRRASVRGVAMIFALAFVITSCGIPEDDRPREIDPTLLEDITGGS